MPFFYSLAGEIDPPVRFHPGRNKGETFVLGEIPDLPQVPVGTNDGIALLFQLDQAVDQFNVFLILMELGIGVK